MKRKRNAPLRWRIDEEKIVWAITIMVTALLIVILSSCKTHRETAVDYQINSAENYRKRRAEEHEKQTALRMAASSDTVKESNTRSGQIEIERDTTGKVIRIIYDHIFNSIQTQGSFRIDTVYQKQVILLGDSIGSGRKDTLIEGKFKEKKDFGVKSWVGLGFCFFWVLIAGVAGFLFIQVKKWRG